MSSNTEVGCSCSGCILLTIVIWVLVFGLTIGGIHYKVGCNTNEGVVFTTETDDEN